MGKLILIILAGALAVTALVFLVKTVLRPSGETVHFDRNMDIEAVWQEYFNYWKKHEPDMTEPCPGESKEAVDTLEKTLGVTLPEDFRRSLQFTYHGRKKCSDNLDHSWFGSRTGVSFYDTKEVLEDLKQRTEKNWFDIIEENVENRYFGGVKPYTKGTRWPKEWVIIAYKNGVSICLDLRKDAGDKYGQIIAVKQGICDANDNWFNHIAFVAKDYKEFMILALEEIYLHRGLNDDFFRKIAHLPKDYWDDDWGV